MRSKWLVGAFVLALAVAFAAESAWAVACPPLIGAARRLAANYMGADKAKIIVLIDEAEGDHKQAVAEKKAALHTQSLRKVARAFDMLIPKPKPKGM